MTGSFASNGNGALRRLRRINVLVVSEDEAFLRTATERLRGEGFPVEGVCCQAPPRDDFRRSRPDVVLLDRAGSLGATLRAVAVVEAREPHAAVVVAVDGGEAAAIFDVAVVARAASSRRLAEVVERAFLARRRAGEVPADAV